MNFGFSLLFKGVAAEVERLQESVSGSTILYCLGGCWRVAAVFYRQLFWGKILFSRGWISLLVKLWLGVTRDALDLSVFIVG